MFIAKLSQLEHMVIDMIFCCSNMDLWFLDNLSYVIFTLNEASSIRKKHGILKHHQHHTKSMQKPRDFELAGFQAHIKT